MKRTILALLHITFAISVCAQSITKGLTCGVYEAMDKVEGLSRQAYMEINITDPSVPDISQTFKKGELHKFNVLPEDFMKKPSDYFKGQKANAFVRYRSKMLFTNVEVCKLDSAIATDYGWKLTWVSDFDGKKGTCELHIEADGTLYFVGLGSFARSISCDNLRFKKVDLKNNALKEYLKGKHKAETTKVDEPTVIANGPIGRKNPETGTSKVSKTEEKANPPIDRSKYSTLHMMDLVEVAKSYADMKIPRNGSWTGFWGNNFKEQVLNNHTITKQYALVINTAPKGTYPILDQQLQECHGLFALNNSDPQYTHVHTFTKIIDVRGDTMEVVSHCERSGQEDLVLLVHKGSVMKKGTVSMIKAGEGRPCNLCHKDGKKLLMEKYAEAIKVAETYYKVKVAMTLSQQLGLLRKIDSVVGITPSADGNMVQIDLKVTHTRNSIVYHIALKKSNDGWAFVPEMSKTFRKGNELISTFEEWQ